MTESHALYTLVAELLSSVATGARSGDEAMRVLVEREADLIGDALLEGAWALIQHFADDADIRVRDPAYAAEQRRELVAWAMRLRQAGETHLT